MSLIEFQLAVGVLITGSRKLTPITNHPLKITDHITQTWLRV
jgi:hypothetical protein